MIDLPAWPPPADATPFYIDAGGVLRGGPGAPDQRLNRPGSKYGISVTMPPLKSKKTGRQWVAQLILAQSEGARMRFPLLDFDPGTPGDVRVSGAGQAGSTLTVDGATPYYAFRFGQFFSLVTGGAHHLYMVAVETIADATGHAALPISPLLRKPPADNDVCNFARPMIEGFLSGDERQWKYALGNFVGLEFEMRERR